MKVKTEGRTCFGLDWYDDEAEAVREGAKNRASGQTVNGGFLDGMPCDRTPEFDYDDKDTGKRLYAVRTR